MEDPGSALIKKWFKSRDWRPFQFQEEVQQAYLEGASGLLNAPTGSGKTYALFLPVLADFINRNPDYRSKTGNGLQLLWITPLRALTYDIRKAMQEACTEMEIPWNIAARTGDTSSAERQQQKKRLPEVLLTTPESMHIMLSQKDYPKLFSNLQAIVVDEWHELLGTKRGVQVELALSRIKKLRKAQQASLRIWGVSATIGNLQEAADVLLGNETEQSPRLIRAHMEKKIEVESVLPDDIEKFSWAGHLGIKLLPKIIPIIEKSRTTLVFTNVRSQTEIWFQSLLNHCPELAGVIAMHHGSLDSELRTWVEQALHKELLKVVVCTSSLDLGVDFRPVDTVIQIGSPKGVARFMQRAGRSGHQPGAVSKIYFVPTHSLELVEAAALKEALKREIYESRDPIIKPYDVLIQYLLTLAVSDGFDPKQLFEELIGTYAYSDLSSAEYNELIGFLLHGGKTLHQYDEYAKVISEDGLLKVKNKRTAMRHRLSIGTIVSDPSMRVKFLHGGNLGTIEEGFIARLKPGETFWFAGRNLELVQVKEMTAFVRKASGKSGIVPAWMGGRVPLSSKLSALIREKVNEGLRPGKKEIELEVLKPLFELQQKSSLMPSEDTFLIERLQSRDGYHLFFYPFEGRLVHEGMGSLFAYRIAKLKPFTFSIAMNDYGFELLTDQEIRLEEAIEKNLFSTKDLLEDIQKALNANEMARRKFRDIAHIAGLIFTGYPGQPITHRHLQASTSLLFEVFREYEPDNLLVRQAYNEALMYQLEEMRLREALRRISSLRIVIKDIEKPTPFSFPILVDSMREKLTTEKLEERVRKMKLQYEK